jgi:hypothetical protein
MRAGILCATGINGNLRLVVCTDSSALLSSLTATVGVRFLGILLLGNFRAVEVRCIVIANGRAHTRC